MEEEKIVVRLKIDRSRYKIGEIIKAEKGFVEPVRNLIAKSMIDNKGEFLSFEEACAVLDDMNGFEFDEVSRQFMEKINGLPPVSSGHS